MKRHPPARRVEFLDKQPLCRERRPRKAASSVEEAMKPLKQSAKQSAKRKRRGRPGEHWRPLASGVPPRHSAVLICVRTGRRRYLKASGYWRYLEAGDERTSVELGRRGFASMDPARQRAIAAQGGRSHSREHMREIGRRGGAK